jgi:ABC-type amino acid transport substrate-binding protein
MRILPLLALLVVSLFQNAVGETVRVVTRNVEPFSFQKDGQWTGFAVELWQDVAREMNLESEFVTADTPKQMVEAVQARTADVGVGALSITAEREKVIDFSQPFYESGLGIVVSKRPPTALEIVGSTLASVFNWKFIGSFALLILAMLVISHLVWMFEHKINEDMWPKNYVAGMWESFWWAISTLLVGGADNKGPIGVGGRLVAIAWMLLSIVLIALLTGSFAANLTVDKLQGDIAGADDLARKDVATIRGSTAEAWLNAHGAHVFPFADVMACLDALRDRKVKAVVYDAPILQYQLQKAKDDSLSMVGDLFDRSNYGFALQQDSPLRERMNQALLTLYERGVTDDLRKKYFGASE